MGLEEYMDGFETTEEEKSSESSEGKDSPKPDYTYTGEKELLDVSWDEVKEFIKTLDYNFSSEVPRVQKRAVGMESEDGTFTLSVRYPPKREDWDAILVGVLESETGYDTIEPYPVYFTEEWKEELLNAIETVLDNKDDIILCDKCGGVMIIRTTNTTRERIRGCSNYPDCRNSEIL